LSWASVVQGEIVPKFLGVANESFGFGKENLPQLQNYPAQGRCSRDLFGSTPQAAPRLNARVLEDENGTYRWHQHSAAAAF
jgi:hypothetical protein